MSKKLAYLSGAPRVSTHPDAETSGPRSHVLGVIKAFEKMNWRVGRFIFGDEVPESWVKKGSGEQVTSGALKRLAADALRYWFRIRNGRKALKELGTDFDLVYERFAAMQALGRTFQKRGIPWVLETNAPLFYEAQKERKSTALGSLVHRLEIKAYKNCDHLVCVSQKLKEIVVNEGGIDPGKVIVLPNGVDINFFDPVSVEAKRLFESMVIGFVGTLRPWQRLDKLIQAVASLRKEGLDINAVIVGDGPGKKEWEQLADKLGVGKNIEFVGRVRRDKVPAYIRGFDLGYSAPEPMEIGMYLSPLKLYEYMAMGTPVLASSSEDAVCLVNNGRDGFLVAESTVDQIKGSLKEAYSKFKEDDYMQMRERARHKIVNNHSWESRIEELLESIDSVKSSHA